MKYLKNIFFLLLFLVPQVLLAQAVNKKIIKNSNDYYWGEAISRNEKEASDAALANLTQNIAVMVSSDYQSNVKESNKNIKETVQKILKTFSTATLRNVKTLKQLKDGKIDVFHYIRKSNVENIFNKRKILIRSIYDKANDFENNEEYGYALKWYYFAIILMNSLPDQVIKYHDLNLKTEIPYRITTILNKTKFYLKTDSLLSKNERELVFNIRTNHKPDQYLDFSFWDGSNQVNVQATDGDGTATLLGPSVNFKKLNISIKYSYYENRQEIKDVSELWDLVQKPSFDNTRKIILKKKSVQKKQSVASKKDSLKSNKSVVTAKTDTVKNNLKAHIAHFNRGQYQLELQNNDSCNVLRKISNESFSLISLIKKHDLKGISKYFENDPFLKKRMINMMRYNHLSVLKNNFKAAVNKTYMGWELRKIQVHAVYPSLNKQTTEYLVFDFTPKGKMYNVTFGIMHNLYKKFVTEGKILKDWKHRQVIIKFIEKYRTAFMTRDINTIDSLFSDQAVIIVGRVLKKKKKDGDYVFFKTNNKQPDFKQIRLTKNQYLKRQKAVFKSQQDIYLGYSTFNITRKNKQKGVYGISMRQNYYSSTYSDEGYLFLLVDFNEKNPQIYVRSWQPQAWDDSALIKLSNFNINM
ncbi:MAG TPA: hypothetical protein VKA34_07910 [Balneolales bacterium]|nr:hypothetical protein [Balneolales bacterium]